MMRAQKMTLMLAVVALLAASSAAEAGNKQQREIKEPRSKAQEDCFDMALNELEDADGIKGELAVRIDCRNAVLNGRMILTVDGELLRDAHVSGVDSAELEGLLEGDGEVEVCGYFIGQVETRKLSIPAVGEQCRTVDLGEES